MSGSSDDGRATAGVLFPHLGPPARIHGALLQRLGAVVTRWAVVEMMEGEFLAFLVDAEHGAMYAITQTVSASAINGWVRTLLPLRLDDEEVIDRANELFVEIDRLRGERNILVHRVWEPGKLPKTAVIQTVRPDRREIVRADFTTTADLDHLIESIDLVTRELTALDAELGFTDTASLIR